LAVVVGEANINVDGGDPCGMCEEGRGEKIKKKKE